MSRAHRNAMEKHLGRALDRDEVVMHIDGDRSNNRIENLRIVTKREFGMLLQPVLSITEPKVCSSCFQMKPPEAYSKFMSRGRYKLVAACLVCACAKVRARKAARQAIKRQALFDAAVKRKSAAIEAKAKAEADALALHESQKKARRDAARSAKQRSFLQERGARIAAMVRRSHGEK